MYRSNLHSDGSPWGWDDISADTAPLLDATAAQPRDVIQQAFNTKTVALVRFHETMISYEFRRAMVHPQTELIKPEVGMHVEFYRSPDKKQDGV